MWNDLNKKERHDFWDDVIAVVIAGILLMTFLIIYEAVRAQPEPYEPECTDIYKLSSSPKPCPALDRPAPVQPELNSEEK